MVFRNMFHRRNGSPWETVGHWEIAPVSIYDSEHADLDILSIDEHDHATSLDMEVKSVADVRKGVAHARTLLYEQIARGRWNTLIQEWWEITLMRRGKQNRLLVRYHGRAAKTTGMVEQHDPPFWNMLLRLSLD